MDSRIVVNFPIAFFLLSMQCILYKNPYTSLAPKDEKRNKQEINKKNMNKQEKERAVMHF